LRLSAGTLNKLQG
jgi:uncharacterized small protein (DUF1192 family)